MKFEEHDKEEQPKGAYTPRYDPNSKGKATTSYTEWSENPKPSFPPKEDTNMEKTKVAVPKEKFEELRKCFDGGPSTHNPQLISMVALTMHEVLTSLVPSMIIVESLLSYVH